MTLVAAAREAVFDRLDWQLARLRRELETAARFTDEGAAIIAELAAMAGGAEIEPPTHEPPTLASIGLGQKEGEGCLVFLRVTSPKFFLIPAITKGLGRALFGPGVFLGKAERGLSEEERDG